MKPLAALIIAASFCWGQGQAVNQMDGPTPNNQVGLFFYDGSSRLIYACYAPAFGPLTTYARADSSLTNIVVLTNAGTINLNTTAQLWVGQQITVSGSATVALNATYKVTAVSGSTATITTSGVGNATYTDAALKITTNAPVLNGAVWAIRALNYVTAGLATSYWAGAPSVNVPNGLLCSNRANY